MAVGDVFYEVQRFDDHPEGQFLAKITVEDPAEYLITIDGDGALQIEPKPKPQPQLVPSIRNSAKYRLEPAEGGLFRPVLLHPLRNLPVGTIGGLITGDFILSHKGECWIDGDSKVIDEVQVRGDARVHNSILTGRGTVSGDAYLNNCRLTGVGYTDIGGNSRVNDVHIANDSTLTIDGRCIITNTQFTLPRTGEPVEILGCAVENGHIRSHYEILSIATGRWGWLSAYRSEHGELKFTVGCQNKWTLDELHQMAVGHDVSPGHRQMLDAFYQMAMVARGLWRPEPGAATKSEPEPGPVASFAEMAERAREVSQVFAAPRPPVPPLAPLRTDQYGADLGN